jgi:3-isopropylmalate/(R)-2-methylmalate dehydratase large subunit
MAMTITDKILADHANRKQVAPGDLVNARVDMVLANDITAPIAIKQMEAIGSSEVFDPDKIVIVQDHFTPNKDIASAQQCKLVREFARSHRLTKYYDVGTMGIEHALLPEKGLVLPGELLIGGDSHTCTHGALGAFATGMGSTDIAAAMILGETWLKVPETLKFSYSGHLKKWITGKDLILFTIGQIGVDGASYKAMEVTGDVMTSLPMSGRFTMCNMAIEAGAKNGIVAPDEITRNYLKERTGRTYRTYESDPDADYSDIIEIDVSEVELQVALPHLPENSKPVSEVGKIEIDQVVIGSCTNGRLDDLRQAGEILRGRQVSPRVRTIIVPATQETYRQAVAEGLVDIFVCAGVAVSTPTCGPCCGGHMGVLAEGEKAVSTTNRNFKGRMGHPDSEVYLSGPAVAAASAVLGRIGSPEELERM